MPCTGTFAGSELRLLLRVLSNLTVLRLSGHLQLGEAGILLASGKRQ